MFNKTISIIGGTGHVGLPLGLAFAVKNYKVQLIDINLETIKNVNNGIMPFKEDGAPRILKAVCDDGLFPPLEWFAKARTKDNEPIRGYVLVVVSLFY